VKTKTITFTEQELQVFETICDHALKSGGTKLAHSVVYFVQKFNEVQSVETPDKTPPTHAETIGK